MKRRTRRVCPYPMRTHAPAQMAPEDIEAFLTGREVVPSPRWPPPPSHPTIRHDARVRRGCHRPVINAVLGSGDALRVHQCKTFAASWTRQRGLGSGELRSVAGDRGNGARAGTALRRGWPSHRRPTSSPTRRGRSLPAQLFFGVCSISQAWALSCLHNQRRKNGAKTPGRVVAMRLPPRG